MTRSPLLAVTCGFLMGLALGCGSSKPRGASGNGGDPAPGKAGDPLQPGTARGSPAKKARLAELEKVITAKEKELADLKAEADGLRKEIAADEAPKDKVYRTGAELLADMPRDAYPKFGPEFRIERAKAQKWCKENLPGRTIEWAATVKEVAITGDGPFSVVLTLEGAVTGTGASVEGGGRVGEYALGGSFPLGGQPCQVSFWGETLVDSGIKGNLKIWYSCTAAEADTLRSLKGKRVTFRATAVDAKVADGKWEEGGVPQDRVPIGVVVSVPSADGFVPEADKPKPKDRK